MRVSRPRAPSRSSHLLAKLGASLLFATVSAIGCATEVNTLDEGEPDGDGNESGTGTTEPTAGKSQGGAGTGGKSQGGQTSMAGASAGKSSGAFGGTGSSGGSTNGTAGQAGAAGSGGSGGASGGSGGKATGGTGGSSAGGTGGSSAGASGSAGTGGGGPALECLKTWKNDACDTCSTQTQGDKLGCVDILDCYAANSCGPSTCGSNDAQCGANKIAKGTAGYPIAEEVYDCLCN